MNPKDKATVTEELKRAVAVLGDEKFTRRKNRRKRLRMIGEIASLVAVSYILARAFFTFTTYEPYPASAVNDTNEDTGFVALSYFGVDRTGHTSTLIGEERLGEHLRALRDNGYVTITTEDIEGYYRKGQPLPDRSLYLMFEDGRRDTSIFAQHILEDLNYKATAMTYPEKFAHKDVKFLSPKDFHELENTSYWELGTNGFRLEYINVFDRYNNYLGEIDPLRYAIVQKFLNRRYNHYLMDYLRDKNDLPKESYEHMRNRINYDYERLDSIYQKELGYVPRAHVLMHANTGRFGNNQDVSKINEKWIRSLFSMNFNREGDCFNRRNSSIYDLTRMQPQPYWPVNHLLMRIKYDTRRPIEFKLGDAERQKDWQVDGGVAEIGDEVYTLTTEPYGAARARLLQSDSFRDMHIGTRVRGNAFGSQKIFLRASENLDSYVCVALTYDHLIVTERSNGQTRELYREKVPVILGEKILSEEEARQEAEVGENNAFARYARSPEEATVYLNRAQRRAADSEPTVEEGAKPYEGTMSFHQRMDHWLDISIKGTTLKVTLDETASVDDIELRENDRGYIVLGADWQEEGWSQRNLADDVYDAVFDQFTVQSNSGDKDRKDEKILFTMKKQGWERAKLEMKRRWEDVLRWFIEEL